jgi:hypothetical protein
MCMQMPSKPMTFKKSGPARTGVLDIYHASTYIANVGKALFGEASADAKAWLEEGRARLLSDGLLLSGGAEAAIANVSVACASG